MIQEDHPNFKWLVLLTVIIGTFLGRLDQTIVNLALPKIIMDFKNIVAQTVLAFSACVSATLLPNCVSWADRFAKSCFSANISVLAWLICLIASFY